ncbi:RHS repeat-associated core domain-containing protein [Salmonella bongori]|uniref:RHS repeat-associated core domain-containing protein n=1 Tax=Salmonella bongori TaxID=54736 RepID=UPI002868358F|nr:RHS repeat-associated core domain-containing protein [Salmonella bongori]
MEKLVDKGGYRPLRWRYRWDARSQLTEEIPVGTDGTPEYENAIRWIYEPGSFTPLARYEKGQLHYTITDTVGRIQELLTEDGTIVWRGKQHLWGREEGRNKDDAPSCRLRFPGQYEDEESGLYYNRFRYYDCDTGQYLCADPIGLRGGINLYAYVVNPLTWIDPLGLFGCGPKAQKHILHGDGPGSGGHMWPGQPGKTTFPQSWDGKKIISEVDDIVNSPSTKWYAQQGTGGALTKSGKAATWVAWEVRDGVQIRVVYQPAKGRIVTAFPDSGPVPRLSGAK